MTNATFHICIVDDTEFHRLLAASPLRDAGYTISECNSGEACLDMLASGQASPDLILLDIEMQGIDGYETCRRIRAAGHEQLQIMFASAHNDLASRLSSFDAGGDDFIAKPISTNELLHKITVAQRARRNISALAQDKLAAEEMSTAILDSLDDLNSIQKFLRDLLHCKSFDTLARLINTQLATQGCHSVVQLRATQAADSLTLTRQGPATALEQSILEQSRQLERIFQFRSRLIINFEHVSILITNMPPDDDVHSGRIRDYAAIIAEAADVSVENINLQTDLLARARQVQLLARASRDAMSSFHEQYTRQQQQTRQELETMTEHLERMYYRLVLSSEQEDDISSLVHESTTKILALLEQSSAFDRQFDTILSRLEEASSITVEAERQETMDTQVWL